MAPCPHCCMLSCATVLSYCLTEMQKPLLLARRGSKHRECRMCSKVSQLGMHEICSTGGGGGTSAWAEQGCQHCWQGLQQQAGVQDWVVKLRGHDWEHAGLAGIGACGAQNKLSCGASRAHVAIWAAGGAGKHEQAHSAHARCRCSCGCSCTRLYVTLQTRTVLCDCALKDSAHKVAQTVRSIDKVLPPT